MVSPYGGHLSLTIDTMVICIVCKIQAGEELVPKASSSQPASQSLCIIPEAAQMLCPQWAQDLAWKLEGGDQEELQWY
jgi:hypothetical protein